MLCSRSRSFVAYFHEKIKPLDNRGNGTFVQGELLSTAKLKEITMAALSKGGLFGQLWPQSAPIGKSKRVHEFAVRAYKNTNGPTEELKKLYKAYRENQAKSSKVDNAGGNSR